MAKKTVRGTVKKTTSWTATDHSIETSPVFTHKRLGALSIL